MIRTRDYEIMTMNWPRFLLVESGDDSLLVTKLSPFAIDKGFQAPISVRLRSIERLRNGTFGVWHKKAKWPSPQVPEISRQAYDSRHSSNPKLLAWCYSLPWTSRHEQNRHTRWVEWAGSDIGQVHPGAHFHLDCNRTNVLDNTNSIGHLTWKPNNNRTSLSCSLEQRVLNGKFSSMTENNTQSNSSTVHTWLTSN